MLNSSWTPVAIASVIVFALTAGYWGRRRFFEFRRGSAAEERAERVNLVFVAAQGVLASILPFAVDLRGLPIFAYVASALLLGSVFLYRIKRPDLRLSHYSPSGRHAEPEAPRQPTTRWPYTVAYMIGYAALFAYILSMALVR